MLDGTLPNQELSVLYGGPTLNYGGQLFLYVPHMLRVNMTRDLAHLQLSDLRSEIRPICRTSDLQEKNAYMPNVMAITYFYMHFLFIFFIRRCFTY